MPWRHGLCVVPCSLVRLRLTPPNSLAVVWPASTAPPRATIRCTIVAVWVATRSRNGTDASVSGHPSTWVSSFTPMGTPPNGKVTSAAAAADRAASRSSKHTAFRSLASTAAKVASSSSTGDRSPERNASTNPTASPVHVSLTHGADCTGRLRSASPWTLGLFSDSNRPTTRSAGSCRSPTASRRPGASCSVAPVWAPPSRRSRARPVATACGRPPSTCRTRSRVRSSTSTSRLRSAVIRSARRARCVTSPTARS